MRLRIRLDMTGVWVPFDYRRGIQAFIYSCMDRATGKALHEGEPGTIKLFSFSRLMGKSVRQGPGSSYTGTAVLVICSPYELILTEIFEKIRRTGHIELYGSFIPVLEMKSIENPGYSGTVGYRTMAPVTVYTTEEDGFHRYYSPEEDDYADRIQANIARKYEQITGTPMTEYFNMYMTEDIRKRVCTYKGFRYTAYDFTCKIDTVPLVHSVILDCGLGARNPAGFGMMDLVRTRMK